MILYIIKLSRKNKIPSKNREKEPRKSASKVKCTFIEFPLCLHEQRVNTGAPESEWPSKTQAGADKIHIPENIPETAEELEVCMWVCKFDRRKTPEKFCRFPVGSMSSKTSHVQTPHSALSVCLQTQTQITWLHNPTDNMTVLCSVYVCVCVTGEEHRGTTG